MSNMKNKKKEFVFEGTFQHTIKARDAREASRRIKSKLKTFEFSEFEIKTFDLPKRSPGHGEEINYIG